MQLFGTLWLRADLNSFIMTISKYNHFILKDGKYLLYNALSNALIEITQDLYTILKGGESVELIMEQDKEIFSQLKL